MICPNCGKGTPQESGFCEKCGYPLTDRPIEEAEAKQPLLPRRTFDPAAWQKRVVKGIKLLGALITWIVSLSILGYGAYKAYYWYRSAQIERMYESGQLPMPVLEEATLSDGRVGRVVTFYGDDGDMIYIEELRRSFLVVGGEARVEIPDSYWFSMSTEDVESADIALTPVKTHLNGGKELLPIIQFHADVPTSPLKVVSPSENQEPILTSVFQLELEVVPGSTVLVDGEDVTDFVSVQGKLSVNVSVYPQGENPISILVQTPHHRETRADIVLYRQPMEINLELAVNTPKSSVSDAMTIRGSCDPTARVSVDTPCLEGSLTQDEEGNFSFVAQFDHIGYNNVRFRAKEEGKRDSILSFDVYYLPTENEYSRKAWAMDYVQLCRCWDIWAGKIFKCEGTVEAVLAYDPQTIVLDVSQDGSGNFLILENLSGLSATEVGEKFIFYADVSGVREEYMGRDYPFLYARFAKRPR